MNEETTHQLIEILEALEEFIAIKGYDETPVEDHARERYNSAIYNTQKLADTFLKLEREGYSALGLSLVLDLINRDCLEPATL